MNIMVLNKLKAIPGLIADKHEGCYELVRLIIDLYK